MGCKRCVALLSDPDSGIITVRICIFPLRLSQAVYSALTLFIPSCVFVRATLALCLPCFQVICCFAHIFLISSFFYSLSHCLDSASHYTHHLYMILG